jgi:RND family efflux transporter MFP subunit
MSTPADLSRLRISREEPPSKRRAGLAPWIGLVAVLLLAAVAWAFFQPRPILVDVATANATGGGSISASGITANGYVVARTKASVSAEIMGRLEYLNVREGSTVKQGEVIARIKSDDYRAALAAAHARAEQLRLEAEQADRDLKRAEELSKRDVIAVTDLENARTKRASSLAAADAAKADAALAQANYEHTSVHAPFAGTVLRKDAEVGEIVAPSSAGGGLTRTAIVTMADLSTLEVEVDVNEAYIAQVRNGQKCRITLDAYPDTTFAGVARQVVPTADRDKATVQVKVSILDHDPRILPEMGAKVEFLREADAPATAAPRRVLVPGSAVVHGAGGDKVWVVAEGKAASRTVDVGPPRGDQIEIRRGLEGGETIVIGAPARLKDGAAVRVKK